MPPPKLDLSQWMAERRGLLSPLAACGAFLALMLLPGSFYWQWLFEGGRLHATWPVLFLLAAGLFVWTGFRLHQSHGRPQFFPHLGSASLVFFLVTALLATGWAVDWPAWWGIAAWGLLTLVLGGILVAVLAYTEAWRRAFNAQVVRTVHRALRNGRFRRHVEERWQRRKRTGRREWGSPHCARIVEEFYETVRREALGDFLQPCPPEVFRRYLDAGESWGGYLLLDWPEDGSAAARRRWQTAEILREMLTLTLWRRGTAPAGAPPEVEPKRITGWIERLRQAVGDPYRSYGDFFDLLAGIANAQASEEREVLLRILERFGRVPAGTSPLGHDLREVCAVSWLAVAPRHLSPAACLSVWMALREERPGWPFLPPARAGEEDLAAACARSRLAGIYAALEEGTPAPWRQAVAGRREHAETLAAPPSRIESRNGSDSAGISSWLYRYVLETWTVQLALLGSAAALSLIVALALGAAAPRLPWSWGWNSVDHVSDRRFWGDYTRYATTAMAGSERWLALGTEEEGLVLVRKDSRIPRERVTPGGVLDVARGPGRDDFFVLQADQGISRVDAGGLIPSRRPWLAAPENPVWKGVPGPGEPEIVANQLAEDGWLVAVRGLGVARYLAEALPGGGRHRLRSWQTGDLSSVSLDLAVITREGVWITLAGGGIRFAGRASLSEVSGRSAETPPIVRLEADPEGRWASAVDSGGNLWLYAQDGPGWLGPLFAGGGDSGPRLLSAADVTLARRSGETVWLGTRYGLFAYDGRQRRIRTALKDSGVRDLVPLAGPGRVLVNERGLLLVEGPAADGSFKVQELDPGPVLDMSLSPDGQLCVYRVRLAPPGEAPAVEVRALHAPYAGQSPEILAPGRGWKTRPEPGITGVAPLGEKLLFATSNGAFLYAPTKRRYQDASTSRLVRTFPNGGNTVTDVPLRSFSSLEVGRPGLLALADGTPQLLAPGATTWLDLDPERKTRPVQLLEAGGQILGLGARGEIMRYSPPAGVESFLTGSLGAVRPPSGGGMPGDLLRTGEGFRLAWMVGGFWARYDSADGRLAEAPLPAGGVAQLRLTATGPLFLRGDGSVLLPDGKGTFGGGGSPFPPLAATALAPGGGSGEVLLGGPEGSLVRYNWERGSWSRLRSLPEPRPVRQVQRTAAGTFARTDSALFLLAGDQPWRRLAGAKRWAADPGGRMIWLLRDDGLERFASAQPQEESAFFATGSGMRDLAARATFAWQMDPFKIALLTSSPRMGVYDARTDQWREGNLDGLRAPQQFTPGPGSLTALDGGRVVRVGTDLQVVPMAALPRGASGTVLHGRVGGGLELAFRQGLDVVLWIWDATLASPPRELRLLLPDVAGLAFSATDRLWCLRPGRLVELASVKGTPRMEVRRRVPVAADATGLARLPDGNLQVATRSGSVVTMRESKDRGLTPVSNPLRGEGKLLAALPFAGRHLDWRPRPEGGIEAAWREAGNQGAPPPVWASSGGRLALQAVRDVALGRAGELLVLTEAGLAVRDAGTFALRALRPEIRGFDPAAQVLQTVVSGPWRFELHRPGTGRASLRILDSGEARPRRVIPAEGGRFRFADDTVRGLVRDSAGRLWLTTADGTWELDLARGRRGTRARGPVREAQVSYEDAAVRIAAAGGRVRLRAFDGGEVFSAGRFFFDNGKRMAAVGGSLYVLVPGRCVLHRDPGSLGRITGCWPLPPGLPPAARSRLARSAGGLRLIAEPGSGGPGAWDLDASAKGAAWQPVRPSAGEPVGAGPVAWRPRAGFSGAFEPIWVPSGRVLGPWWSGDRFAWDQIYAAGALGAGSPVLLTASGPIVLAGSRPVAWWPVPGLRDCAVARQQGRATGLALSGGTGVYHLSLERSEAPVLRPWTGNRPPAEQPVLILGRLAGERGSVIGLREVWESVQAELVRAPRRALRSELPALPDSALIVQGQFAFDRIAGAAPLGRGAGSWIGFTSQDAGARRICRYEVRGDEAAGRPRLLLREIWAAPGAIEALRPWGEEGFLVRSGSLTASGSARVRVQEGNLTWSEAGLEQIGEAFRTGDRVHLDVPAMRWTAEPHHPWDASAPFSAGPEHYPVFSRQPGGIALSFDVLTSLAFDRDRDRFILATRGGVYISPDGWERGRPSFFDSTVGPTFRTSPALPPSRWLIEARRVRLGEGGDLWVKLAVEEREVLLGGGSGSGNSGDRWPADQARVGSHEVHLGTWGLTIDGKQFTRSNDAWGLDRTQLSGFIDIEVDERSQTLWLATTTQGLVKVVVVPGAEIPLGDDQPKAVIAKLALDLPPSMAPTPSRAPPKRAKVVAGHGRERRNLSEERRARAGAGMPKRRHKGRRARRPALVL
jgi:hypothetical protein